jgi:phosphoesterase RecJ-like protein
MPLDYSGLPSVLRAAAPVAVISHIKPDGDCIGAQVALCRWLESFGIQYTAFNEDPVPGNLQWLTRETPVQPLLPDSLKGFAAAVLLDGNALKRFSRDPGTTFAAADLVTVMIDHHPEPDAGFTHAYSQTDASSTCEMIWDVYRQTGTERIDPTTARALFTGLLTDTGSFQFDSVTPDTLSAAADILRLGDFGPSEVAEQVFASRTLATQRLMGHVLSGLELYENGRISVIALPFDTLSQFETLGEVDTDGFVNQALNIEGVDAALFFKETAPEEIKISLRSKSDIDVNRWARQLDGGGHRKAAGASYRGTLRDAIQDTLAIGRSLHPSA